MVTWPEINAALGDGEARRVFDEHRRRIEYTESCSTIGINKLVAIACLVRAELWCTREAAMEATVYATEMWRNAERIRAIRKCLECEVWGEKE